MKKPQINLPEKSVKALYQFKSRNFKTSDTTTATTSQGDPTNSCTTILTTTHFL